MRSRASRCPYDAMRSRASRCPYDAKRSRASRCPYDAKRSRASRCPYGAMRSRASSIFYHCFFLFTLLPTFWTLQAPEVLDCPFKVRLQVHFALLLPYFCPTLALLLPHFCPTSAQLLPYFKPHPVLVSPSAACILSSHARRIELHFARS